MSEQVALYEATDAREGALVVRTVVVLTTIGAKSGNNPKNPVMRIKSGATYMAVASDGRGRQKPCVVPPFARTPRYCCRTPATGRFP